MANTSTKKVYVLYMYYEKLMGHSIDILKSEMLKKQAKIINYGRHKKYEINSTDPQELQAIRIILKHFKDDNNMLFKIYPVSSKYLFMIMYIFLYDFLTIIIYCMYRKKHS